MKRDAKRTLNEPARANSSLTLSGDGEKTIAAVGATLH